MIEFAELDAHNCKRGEVKTLRRRPNIVLPLKARGELSSLSDLGAGSHVLVALATYLRG